jgi:hypothetical protein
VSVMVSGELDEGVKQWASGSSFKRQMATVGFPVLVSLRDHEAYYSEKGPLLVGRAFTSEFRKIAGVVLNSNSAW